MKKELLKISDLSCEDSQGVRLDRTTMYGFAGERIGLLGLSRSGKDFLMQILKGATDQNLELWIKRRSRTRQCSGNLDTGSIPIITVFLTGPWRNT